MSERSPEAIEAAARAYEGDDQWVAYSGTLRGDALEDARRALDAANQVDPVVPLRELRDWIEEERLRAMARADHAGSPAIARIASKWVFDALSRVLDEYDPPTTTKPTA